MREMKRRTFLVGMGIVGGSAFGLGTFNPFDVRAQGSTLRYGFNGRDIRRLDPMGGPNSIDKTILAPD